MEVGSVLPQAGEWRGAILFRGTSRCVAWCPIWLRFANDITGRVQSDIGISQRRAFVTSGALPRASEDDFPPGCSRGIEAAGQRRRGGEAQLIGLQRREFGGNEINRAVGYVHPRFGCR